MAQKQPRKASTVVLRSENRLLMIERAPAQPFLGGFHGFPGGVVDPGDDALPAKGPADGGTRAGALRELFEETGILLTEPESTPGEAARLYADVEAGEIDFRKGLRELGKRLATERLVDAGVWLTPAFSERRFDTFFFLADVNREYQPGPISPEIVGAEWIAPGEAIRRWREHDILLVPPTLNMLRAAEGTGTLEECRAAATRVPGSRRTPSRRIEIRQGMIVFPIETSTLPPHTHTNTILFGEGEMAVIDPGSKDEGEQQALLDLLDELGGEGRRPKEIVLTHHHPDHVGGAKALQNALSIPIAAHPATALLLRGEVHVDRPIHDEEILHYDGPRPRSLRALHTPGHAPGHLSFYESETGTLLAGDNVLGHGTVMINPPRGDMDQYLATLARLKGLHARVLIGGHGTVVGDPGRKIEAYIAHRLMREKAILSLLEDADIGVRRLTTAAIVSTVYQDIPQKTYPLAERSVLAHLIRLEKKGKVQRGEGDVWRAAGGDIV